MTQDSKKTYQTRESILNLLSESEVAHVSKAETVKMHEGEEYLDLKQLEQGIRTAKGHALANNVIPKSAVHADTWAKIVATVAPQSTATAHPVL